VGCTEVNGNMYVPGTGLLLDLVAMLITDVRAKWKWTAGSPAGPLASGARFSSRHCKGAPATPFPPLQMTSVITGPINCFVHSGRSNTGKIHQAVGRPAVD
jgi:hypothetical protein